MPINLTMPRLSDTMVTGKVIEWKKKVGDKIEPGDVLAEIESDKATMEFEAFEEGILLEIRVPAGSTAPVGEVLAVLGEIGESSVEIKSTSTKPEEEKSEITEEKKSVAKKKSEKEVTKTVKETSIPQTSQMEPSKNVLLTPSQEAKHRIFASPLALRMAAEYGIDLSKVKGTGTDGRITRADIERMVQNQVSGTTQESVKPPTKQQEPITHQIPSLEGVATELSQMRAAIARRMAEGWQTPMFTITMDIRMDAIVQIREQWKTFEENQVPTINDFVIWAVSRALTQYPKMNVSFQNQSIIQHQEVNVGFAVALPDGLITPVIFNANKKSLIQIAQETRILIEKALARKLQPEEFSNSTFTISNLGKMEVEHFTAIVNPPEAGILAIGRIREAVVVQNGKMTIENRMYVTLSADHRAVDGAMGAEFVKIVKRYLENPVALILNQ